MWRFWESRFVIYVARQLGHDPRLTPDWAPLDPAARGQRIATVWPANPAVVRFGWAIPATAADTLVVHDAVEPFVRSNPKVAFRTVGVASRTASQGAGRVAELLRLADAVEA